MGATLCWRVMDKLLLIPKINLSFSTNTLLADIHLSKLLKVENRNLQEDGIAFKFCLSRYSNAWILGTVSS